MTMKMEQMGGTADEILDMLRNGVVAGLDDLMGMGECLNLLDRLEQASDLPPSSKFKIDRVKALFNRIILEDSTDPKADWEEIQGIIPRILSSEDDEDDDQVVLEALLSEPESLAGDKDEIPAAQIPFPAPSASPIATSEEIACAETVELGDPELLKDFIDEAKEHLASIELNMLSLETNPEDMEAINAVFRPFHSVKGVAGFLNLKDIHHLSHEVENLLDEARSGTLQVTEKIIDIVLSAVDILKALLKDLEKGLSTGTAPPSSSEVVRVFLERIKNLDGDEPEPLPVRNKVGSILVEKGLVEPHVVEAAVLASDSKGIKLGEELIRGGAVTPREVGEALREQRRSKESAASIRVDTQKLDNLVDMVGELVIAQSMVLQNPEVLRVKDQKLQKDMSQLGRITAELQRISLSLRMVPIRGTFQKMIRLVRDLSKKSGKEVILELSGEDTEIDRNMVEEIYEPLVHMIRNAVDHGVEPPDARVKAGKPPAGTIVLSAEQKGGNITIHIQDDGQGLNAGKIRSRALERGLISPNDQLDERAVFDLIFQPGFSTRETVTEVSGRGVGMDVVRQGVERLRGKVEITSVWGKGSQFELKLPLTMAIIDGMVIRVGEERFVIPTIAMRESLRPAQDSYVTVQGKGELIKVRQQLMPLVRLHRLLGVEPRFINPWEGLLLVVQEDKLSYCLLADEIVGRQEVVIKSLGTTLRHLLGISGGAILGDGKVALIVDVKGLVSLYEGSAKS